jgi:hypothetical protein
MKMFQRWIKQIFLCGMFCFTACALIQAETVLPDEHNPASKNIVVSYFSGAELQAETKSQLREIKKALNDMLNLSIPELQARRYADYQMAPDQWSLGELLNAYFLSADGSPQETDARFYKESKQAEAQRILRQKLYDVEEAIPHGAGE